MLLQAKKEFAICGDLQADDVFFYYTTTSVLFVASINHKVTYAFQRMDDVEFPSERSERRVHSRFIRW
jgi:hypothetical protein